MIELRQTWYKRLRKRTRSIIGFALVKLLAPIVRKLTDSKYFYAFERRGVHVTPVHFYQPIPDTRTLSAQNDVPDVDPPELEFNASKQRILLRLFAVRHKHEYSRFARKKGMTGSGYFLDNGAFGYVDAEILHCMIRYLRPKRIIEIGCGFSTLVSKEAIQASRRENPRYRCTITAIDPHPHQLVELVSNSPVLIRQPVQSVPLREFEVLRSGDILFIDSSHVLTSGGDVQYELLQILPRLRKGVYVHFHDIFLPADYPRDWARERAILWNEQYAIHAFLQFNTTFEVVWSSAYMKLKYPHELKSAIDSFDEQGPSPASMWLRRVR